MTEQRVRRDPEIHDDKAAIVHALAEIGIDVGKAESLSDGRWRLTGFGWAPTTLRSDGLPIHVWLPQTWEAQLDEGDIRVSVLKPPTSDTLREAESMVSLALERDSQVPGARVWEVVPDGDRALFLRARFSGT